MIRVPIHIGEDFDMEDSSIRKVDEYVLGELTGFCFKNFISILTTESKLLDLNSSQS